MSATIEVEVELSDCACQGGETATRHGYGNTDMEECRVCGKAVAWHLVDHPFFGFGDRPCKEARELFDLEDSHA